MSGSILVERTCHGTLVVRIAGLDIHQAYFVEEGALTSIHLPVESAELSQPFVFVDVGRNVVTCGRPVGFEHLFYNLMAHECGI